MEEHRKNARPSTENKHQKGNARRVKDQGGQKKKQSPKWKDRKKRRNKK